MFVTLGPRQWQLHPSKTYGGMIIPRSWSMAPTTSDTPA